MGRNSSRPAKPAVISATGSRDTRIVGALRVGVAAATIGALVAVGRLFDGGGSRWGVVAVAFALLAAVSAFTELAYGGHAARAEERRIRADLLQRQYAMASAATDRTSQFPPGQLIQMMSDNTERVTEYRQIYFGATLAAMAIPFLVLLYIGVVIDWVVGFGVLLLVPFIPLLIFGFSRVFRKTSAHSRTERARLSGRYLDAIRNLVTIRLLGAGPRIEEELRVQGEANRGAIMRLLAGNQIVIIVTDGLFALVLICATAALSITRAPHLSNAETLTILLLTVLLLEPLQQVAGFFYIGMGGMASMRAIGKYLAASDEVHADTTLVQQHLTDTPAPDADQPAIAMSGVGFDYGRGPVLTGIDLIVPAGSRVAIVGPSGVGKSTLMGLLRGALPPQEGEIRLAGHLLDPSDPATTRALTATVGQSTWMFTGTIADNLRIAKDDATDDEMWAALAQAHVDVDVRRMPRGLDTYLGEGAALVSGGQAQRLSLARALLSGRRILLLDEPTSQVDMESEERIIEAIADLPRDRTVLMITHRPSLLRIADAVHELKDGVLHTMEVAR